jgi:hypothetical protein
MRRGIDWEDVAGRAHRQSVLPIIEKYGGKNGQRLLAGAATMQLAMPAVKWVRAKRQKEDYTIAVAGTDDIYPLLHEWVLERIPDRERKAMICDTGEGGGYDITRSFDSVRKPPKIRLRYDGSREQSIVLEGHKIIVAVSREEISGGREKIPENWRRALETVMFTATEPAGRDAVVRVLEELNDKAHSRERAPSLLMPSRWGGDWNRRDDLPPRTLESVILKAGQLERLVSDLGAFIESETEYAKLSQPWHRGYLFHGSAGTGKTSVARALANHFTLPVHYLPLGDLERDADLMSLVGQIRPRSVLLIEDIDVYHAAVDREDDSGKASLAAMLNALDGVWTPHGLITILTTNHMEALDEALVRAGRVDLKEEFSVLDANQARRLSEFCGGLDKWDKFVGHSPADMMEAIRREKRIGGSA